MEALDGHLVPYEMRVPPAERPRTRRWRLAAKILSPLLALLVLAAAILVLSHTLQGVKYDDVAAALGSMHIVNVLVAAVLVAVSYTFLIGYDLLALHHLGKRLALPQVAVGGFVAFALANSLGFVLLTAGSVRYRVYHQAGVTAADVAVITVMSGLTFSLSAMLVAGFCFLMAPQALGSIDGVPAWVNLVFGTLVIAMLGAYVGWVGSGRKAITWSGYELSLPGPLSTLAQLAVGAGDLVCGAAALYMLLPADPGTGFPVFVGLFAVAITLGLISHVPGGFGVFESIMLIAVPNVPVDRLFASLLVFRVLYYLLPMIVAIVLYISWEARQVTQSGGLAGWLKLARLGLEAAVARLRRLVGARPDGGSAVAPPGPPDGAA